MYSRCSEEAASLLKCPISSQMRQPPTKPVLENATSRRRSSVWLSSQVKTVRKMKMAERCWEMVHWCVVHRGRGHKMWKTSWGHPGCRGKRIQFFDGSLGLLLVARGWMKSNWWQQWSASLLLLGAGEDGDKDRNLNGGGNVNVGADLDVWLPWLL